MIENKSLISLCLGIVLCVLSLLVFIVSIVEKEYHVGQVEFSTRIQNSTNDIISVINSYPPVPLTQPKYPFITLAITSFVLSFAVVILNILYIKREKKVFSSFVMLTLVVALFIQCIESYFWIAMNGSNYILFQYDNLSGIYIYDRGIYFFMETYVPSSGGSFVSYSAYYGTVFILITLIYTIIYACFYYLIASNIEGPTISDLLNNWLGSIVRRGGTGYNTLKRKLVGGIVIKIRRRGTTLYSEIELEELNYRHLLDKISFKFDIPIDCIQYITKDEDVDISDDSDVVRLLNNQRLEFIVNVNMLSNNNNNDDNLYRGDCNVTVEYEDVNNDR